MKIEVTFPKKNILIEPTGGGTGTAPTGTGDMLKAVYDPESIEADAFSMENMREAGDALILSPTERSQIADAFNYTKIDHDQVLFYTRRNDFPPIILAENKLYYAADTNLLYLNNGTSYLIVNPRISLGETSITAYRGDRGKIAYDHSQIAHAPVNAQKNSDITKAEIEAKLTGTIASHSHASAERGFAINVFSYGHNPNSGSVQYFSYHPYPPHGAQHNGYIYIGQNCTLKKAALVAHGFGGNKGSDEAWSVIIEANGQEYTIAEVSEADTYERVFANTAMNIILTEGSIIYLKEVNPNWASPPTSIYWGGYLYFQLP